MIFFIESYVIGMLLASWVYWKLVPVGYRKHFLILCSGVGLACMQPVFTAYLLLMTYGVFWAALSIQRKKESAKLVLGISFLAVFLLACKNGPGLMQAMFAHEPDFVKFLLVPLGVSYFTFKFIAFLLDVYRGAIEEFSYLDLLNFIFFLPIFPAGPIERYQGFEPEHENSFSWDSYAEGLKRIVYGYAKKVLIINFLLNEYLTKHLQADLFANINLGLNSGEVYLFFILALIYSYLDLSSYADLAIGFSRLFGYHIIEDMEKPVLKSNISDYWNSWHMSLSGWCRNNVYFPVLGATRRNNFALYCSFFVMGIWHNLTINWVLWGLWHASGLIIYSKWNKSKRKFFKKHKQFKNIVPKPVGKALGMVLTCSYTSMSFSFIFLDGHTSFLRDPIEAVKLILSMFI